MGVGGSFPRFVHPTNSPLQTFSSKPCLYCSFGSQHGHQVSVSNLLKLLEASSNPNISLATSSCCHGRGKWYVPRPPPCCSNDAKRDSHNSVSRNGSLHSLPKTKPRSSKMCPSSFSQGGRVCATFSNTKVGNAPAGFL